MLDCCKESKGRKETAYAQATFFALLRSIPRACGYHPPRLRMTRRRIRKVSSSFGQIRIAESGTEVIGTK